MRADNARCLRSDAQENRGRILEAAAQAFADDGLGVSMVEIARRAGVGNATLHRNFTKEQLIDELFCDWFGCRMQTAERALTDPDPWHALATVLEEFVVDRASNPSLGALFAIRPSWRERFVELLSQLLVRAQRSGDVRPDLSVEDVILALIGIAATLPITVDVAPQQWRRQLQLVLHGMRACDSDRLHGFPVTADQLRCELHGWSADLLRTGKSPDDAPVPAR